MMYCIKKVISTLTASVLTLSIVIPRNFAKETVYAEETANSSESAMSENGTETICDVVIDKAQAQAQITYVASVDCVALLAFYDDDGLSLITSVQKDLTKTEDQTTVTVSLPKSIPEHFLLKAFLLDPNTIAPLSREFVTSVYTAGIQEILNAKASDFDPALTVNLDDNDEENYVVLKRDTVQIPYDGKHNLFDSYDSDNGVYTFTNADANLTGLQPGTNVFCYSPNIEDVVLFNIGDISTNGNTTFVTAGNLNLADAVKVIDLHTKGSGKIDAEPGEEIYPDVTYEGSVSQNQVKRLPGSSNSFETEEAFRFTISTPFMPTQKNDNSKLSLDGSITVEITPIAEHKVLWSEDCQYLCSTESFQTSISTDVAISGKLSFPIPYVSCKLPMPGVFKGEAGLFFVVEAKGSIKGEAIYDLNITTTSDDTKPIVNLKKKNVSLSANTTAFIGFALKISMEVPIENLMDFDVGIKGGIELNGKLECQQIATEDHACLKCMNLDVKLISYFYDKEHLAFLFSHERKVTLFDKTISSMYYSLTFNDGGFGECPHKMKTVSFDFHDETGSYGGTGNWDNWLVNVDEFVIRRDGIVVDTFWTDRFDYQQTASELEEHSYTYEFHKDVLDPVVGVIDGSESKLDLLVLVYGSYYPEDLSIITPEGFDIPGHPNYEKWYHTYPGIGEFTIYSDGHAQLNKLYPETGYVIPEQVGGHTVYGLEVKEDSGYYEEFIDIPEVFMPQTWVEHACNECLLGTGAATIMEPTSLIPSGFFANDHFTQFNLPQTIKSIGAWAFANCSNLTSITIPDNCCYIGKSAFQGEKQLTSIHLPAKLQSVSPRMFYGCDKLETVTIPDRTERISAEAFSYCSSLKSIEIPESVECIGNYAFNNCTSLTSVTIPSNVSSINERAFQYCSSLKKVELEEGITHIGTAAFEGTAIETLKFPESLEVVDEMPIFGMHSLQSVTLPKHNPFQNTNIISDAPVMDIYYPGTLKEWYENGYHLGEFGGGYDNITLHLANDSYQTDLQNVLTNPNSFNYSDTSEETAAPDSSGITTTPKKTLTSGSSVQTLETSSISFNKLQPDACVLLVAVKSKDVPALQPSNLLYIDQTTASASGIAKFTFRTLPEDAIFLIFQQTNETSYISYSSMLPLEFDPVSGDANMDGILSVADVVMLQKWLLNAGRLSCWENCDFNRDDRIDVFDLVLMKRVLLYE